MRSTDGRTRGLFWPLLVLAVLASAAAALGVPIRATYGAQTTADEPQYLLSALSLFEDGDLDIADELRAERWRPFHEAQIPVQTKPLPGGREISPHDPLLPLYLALPMGLGGWTAAKAAMALFAGLVAAGTAWLAIRRYAVHSSVALPVTAVFALSVPLAPYGSQIYPELPAALCTLVAVAALTGPLRRAGCWALGAAVVALPWLAVKYAPVAAVLALLGLVRLIRDGRRAQAVGLGLGLAAAGAVFVGLHLVVWGGLTAYASGDHFVGGEFTAVGNAPNYLGRARRLIGLLVDREFGLAAWQPAWLLTVPALAVLSRTRPAHWTPLWAPLLVGWLNATFVALTMHGYWFPGRQVVVVLPLAVVALTVVAQRSRPFFLATMVAGAVGVWCYGWLGVAGRSRQITWVVDFVEVGDPWYRLWAWLLPAYRFPTPAMWLRHTMWLVAAAAAVLLAAGLRRGRRPAGRRRS